MELPRRNYGDAVRLEVADNCEARKVEFLLSQFGLDPGKIRERFAVYMADYDLASTG